jgi:predicted nuclease of predicted toxin-antitoxin system
MKLLLFDENLSPHLADRLADIYPGSVHISTVGLGSALDRAVWEYARQNDYMIVTKDADFSEMSVLLGSPPKVIYTSRQLFYT